MKTVTATTRQIIENKWVALVLLCTSQFIVIMDTSIIGVALPAIKNDLQYSQNGLQWIFNAYVILFGGTLLLGGRLSDLFGPRKIFVLGFLILTLASVFAGSAWSPASLNIGRAIQGLGAAFIAPSAMTLLMNTFTGSKELGRAFGFWGASAAAGGSAGVFLGGVITEWMDWRWVFYINIPIGIVVLLSAQKYLLPGRGSKGKIDWTGVAMATTSLILLVYAIVSAYSLGAMFTSGLISISVLVFLMFIARQKRIAEPLLPLNIFKAPNLAAGNAVMALMAAAWIPLWFYLNLYLQQIMSLSAFESGLSLLPMTFTIMIVMVGLTGKLIAKFGIKGNLLAGLFSLFLSLVIFSTNDTNGSFLLNVLPASLLGALGMSLAYIPGTITAVSGAGPEESGLASGITNTSYQIGSAIGLAIIVFIASTATRLSTESGKEEIESMNSGFQSAFRSAAFFAGAAFLIAVFKIKSMKKEP